MRAFRAVASVLFLIGFHAGAVSAGAGDRFITLASTTSTENSGLFAEILPHFEQATGIEVRVVAVGTGQALRIARNGDADVLWVHDLRSEEQFVREGFGIERFDVMVNDFVIVGPQSDPAGLRAYARNASRALERIAKLPAPFVSRGDDSGTHKAELRLWSRTEVDPRSGAGSWYRETGTGMGAALNTAVAMGAYALVDRGTWLSFRNRRSHVILVEGDPLLENPYGIIQVNPARHSHVKSADSEVFVNWILSTDGQAAIGAFRAEGEVLFHPSAARRPKNESPPVNRDR